jgi:hypothetical protein
MSSLAKPSPDAPARVLNIKGRAMARSVLARLDKHLLGIGNTFKIGTWLTSVRALVNELRTGATTNQTALGYMCLTSAGLAIGSASKAKVLITTNPVTYLNAGIFKTKATAEVAFTATVHDIADGYKRRYLYSLQADGTPTVTASDAVLIAGSLTTPTCPTGETPIGYVDLESDGAAFVAATTLLDAGTVTDTYVNISHQASALTLAEPAVSSLDQTRVSS